MKNTFDFHLFQLDQVILFWRFWGLFPNNYADMEPNNTHQNYNGVVQPLLTGLYSILT